MNRKAAVSIVVALSLLGSQAAMAKPHHKKSQNRVDNFGAWAEVVESSPIVSYETVSTPIESCRIVERRVVQSERRGDFGPALLGGVIGGVVGHQFGGGKGKTALTIAGALAGAGIASQGNRNAHHDRPQRRAVQECETTYTTHQVERVEGYNVTYEYLGHRFHRVTDFEPGDRIRVQVSVAPVSQSVAYR